MTNTHVSAGWYPDPNGSGGLRWWDGTAWTDRVVADQGEPVRASRSFPAWAWALCGALAVIVAIFLFPVAMLIALVVLATGIVALVKSTPTWLRLRSRRSAVAATGSAAAFILVAGMIAAAVGAANQPAAVEAVPIAATGSATPTPSPPRHTPSAVPTPVTTYREESVTEAIPFERTTTEDPGWARGQSRISVTGVAGELSRVYRVTLVDGVEVGREQISESVTVAPVAEVTVIGVYDPPPAPAPESQSGGCDANYADGCVPIASDVDCAGGSGDGPAYFSGTARVVGSDIYDLDRDGNGIACQS